METSVLSESPIKENASIKVSSPQLIEIFLQEIEVSSESKKEYANVLNCFCNYLKENNICQPRRKDIIAYKEDLMGKGRSPRTVRLYFSVIRSYFGWLEKAGYYPDIACNLKGPRASKEPKRQPLTSSQVTEILNGIDRSQLSGKQAYAMVLIAASTGLRSGELSSLLVRDWVSFGNQVFLMVRRKGYSERQPVAIGPEADASIRECLKAREVYASGEPLFVSTSNRNRGKAIAAKSIGRILKQSLRDRGFNSEYYTGHSYRHTAATLGMEVTGNDIFTVKKFMGHSNIETTILYADHNEFLGKDVAAKIEEKLDLSKRGINGQ